MNTAFSASTSLERLVVTSRPEYNPAASSAKCKSPAYHLHSEDLDALPSALARRMAEPDGTIPDPRELRKFVRRLPALHAVEWIGRGGKGVWQFDKQGTKVNVRFTHSAVRTASVWEEAQRTPPTLTFVEPELRVRAGILTRRDDTPDSPTSTSGTISRIPSGSIRSPDLADSFPTLAEANSRRSGPTTSRAKVSPQTRSPGTIAPNNSLQRQRSASGSTAPSITIQTPKTPVPVLKTSPAVPKGSAKFQGDAKTKGASSSQRVTRSSGTEPKGKEKQGREQTSSKTTKNQASKDGSADKEPPVRVVPGASPMVIKDKDTTNGKKTSSSIQKKADAALGGGGGHGGWIKVGETTRKNKKK
ncbi:hypothetical protein EHS25_008215 [Saitozyma podzolica]|uniref:Uncharacterized protein n=1 Tax=Saitozyma podzolica TaxID=1890683 RepID=A0A427YNY5_9TREE|nr:hypothetical protein EHS25_008215 [Saitozyma podzolica]